MYTPIVSKLYDNDVLSGAEYIAIVRFLHGRQDWMTILKEKTVEEMM